MQPKAYAAPAPTEGMPSRGGLAWEVSGYRMGRLSQPFFEARWVEDLEFQGWDMAHESPTDRFRAIVEEHHEHPC